VPQPDIPPSATPAVQTRGLTKTFTTRVRQDGQRHTATVQAVAGIDLTIPPGQVFALLGPNGAGKTTTQRMLTTLLPVSGGTATIAGFDVVDQQDQVRRHIGYVGQLGGSDLDHATGRENLVLAARLYGFAKADARRRADDLLDAFDLGELADRETSTYSGGQRRRLDVAIGMVGAPDVLFLDEPSTGLDPQNRVHLWDQIRTLRGMGTTVFLTTHYLDEADALADDLAVMDHGSIIAQGSPAALKARFGADTLDDVFLTLTGRELRDTSQEIR